MRAEHLILCIGSRGLAATEAWDIQRGARAVPYGPMSSDGKSANRALVSCRADLQLGLSRVPCVLADGMSFVATSSSLAGLSWRSLQVKGYMLSAASMCSARAGLTQSVRA